MKRLCRWQLSTLVPIILLLGLLTDVTFRFVPLRYLAFRGWEALIVGPGVFGSFQRSMCFRNPRTYGDLAGVSNLRQLRQYRPEVFTTDERGYRNLAPKTPPDAILVGTSFSVGSGVTDAQTLSAQLQEMTGRAVYNAGGAGFEPGRIRRLARELDMKSGVVIYEFLERRTIEPGPYDAELPPPRKHSSWTMLRIAAQERLRVSPLQLLAQRAYKVIEDDRLLPNPFSSLVEKRMLISGESMLFLRDDVNRYGQSRDVRHVAEYFSWFAAELRKDNLDLLVLLVPDKYTVYQPLLCDTQAPPEEPYLSQVARCLKSADVAVIDLAPRFQSEAADRLERGELIYWKDDTHWNPTGIEIAARQIHWSWWSGY